MDPKRFIRSGSLKDKPPKLETDRRHSFKMPSGQLTIPRPLVRTGSVECVIRHGTRHSFHGMPHRDPVSNQNVGREKEKRDSKSSKSGLRRLFTLPKATKISRSTEIKSILKPSSNLGSSAYSGLGDESDGAGSCSGSKRGSDAGKRERAKSTVPSDGKFCYRLPDQPVPTKLRKTVSFQDVDEYQYRRTYSQTYATPIISMQDRAFRMDQLEETIINL